jgi:molybdopterin-biosynthesis enzyme MoeA-like protein
MDDNLMLGKGEEVMHGNFSQANADWLRDTAYKCN